MLRVLLIAEQCNPEWTSVPLVGWNWYKALRSYADITLVTQIRNRAAISRHVNTNDNVEFIDSELVARPVHRLARLLTLGRGLGWTTKHVLAWMPYLYFEHKVWQRFGKELAAGDFDLVHRLTPLSPVYASLLSGRLAVPFMLGPLNGGLPWPRGSTRVRLSEMEFLSYLRSMYRLLPLVRQTYVRAAAVIAGSRHTQREIQRSFGIRCGYMPENGVDTDVFHADGRRPPSRIHPMRILFVGRLVPYKGADVVIEAFAGSSRLRREAETVIVGEGPQRAVLHTLVSRHSLEQQISFMGSLPQSQVSALCRASSVFAFPSIREFGGAVVMEAMACGLPCIVVDYGGPGEYVTDRTGIRIPCGTRETRVAQVRAALEACLDLPLDSMSAAAAEHAHREFPWRKKAARFVSSYWQGCQQ